MTPRFLKTIFNAATSSKTANLAQVGTFLLATGAYFFTVMPVFQNQKLQEDNAKLELEKNKIIEATQKTQERYAELESTYKDQAIKLELQQKEIKENKNALLIAEKQIKSSTTLARRASDQLGKELKALDSARWKIVSDTLSSTASSNYSFTAIRFSHGAFDGKSFMEGEFEWPGIESTINEAILLLKKQGAVPDEYVEKTIVFNRENISRFECPSPDISKIRKDYNSELLGLKERAITDAKNELNRQKESAKKEGKILIIKDSDIEKLERYYLSTNEYKITSKHNEIITDAALSCFDNIQNYFTEFRKQFNVKELEKTE